jgi:hypothetical protein
MDITTHLAFEFPVSIQQARAFDSVSVTNATEEATILSSTTGADGHPRLECSWSEVVSRVRHWSLTAESSDQQTMLFVDEKEATLTVATEPIIPATVKADPKPVVTALVTGSIVTVAHIPAEAVEFPQHTTALFAPPLIVVIAMSVI